MTRVTATRMFSFVDGMCAMDVNTSHLFLGSVRNKGLTIGCPMDNQTEKVGCLHLKSGIQSMFDKHRAHTCKHSDMENGRV